MVVVLSVGLFCQSIFSSVQLKMVSNFPSTQVSLHPVSEVSPMLLVALFFICWSRFSVVCVYTKIIIMNDVKL